MQIFRGFWGKGTIQGMPNCCIACKKAYQQERLVATNDHNKQLIFKFFVCRHSPKTFCSIFEFTTASYKIVKLISFYTNDHTFFSKQRYKFF